MLKIKDSATELFVSFALIHLGTEILLMKTYRIVVFHLTLGRILAPSIIETRQNYVQELVGINFAT